jgi:spermidine/putrescine transport system permease protein
MTQSITAQPVRVAQGEFTVREGVVRRDMAMRRIGNLVLLKIIPVAGYIFLWVPIVLLVIFSFNDSRSVSSWQGFTFQWYTNIFNNIAGSEARFSTSEMLQSFGASITVALATTAIATVLGVMVGMALARGNFRGKAWVDALLFLPIVIPEITQGVSLLMFFNVIFDGLDQVGVRSTPGFGTVIIGHVVFSVSFVAIIVRARFSDMNPRLEEAARDLGANTWRTFWRVTFPLILPAVISGALLAFTLSLDDFVITFFLSGVGSTTLPVFVFGLLRTSVTPEINAISTLILMLSTVLIVVAMALQGRNAGKT